MNLTNLNDFIDATAVENLKYLCNKDSARLAARAEAFIFDRTIADQPIKLADSGVLKYSYSKFVILYKYVKFIHKISLSKYI